LAEVLAAGPHAERPKYDPLAAEAARAGDVPLEAVGKDAKMPWESDGKRWHTVERVSHKGTPCRWEGTILEWLDERVHEGGDFSDTSWDERTSVEIAAPTRSHGWFFHAHTGLERYVRLVFHVGKNTFKEADLRERLGIRRLNEIDGLDVYGDEQRVQVANRKGPWQEVAVLAHRLSEIDTPAFRRFLSEAIISFHANLKRLRTKPEDVMPWKVNGERWHLGDKGFPPGRKIDWDRGLLTRLLALMREIEPKLEVRWDARDAITLRVPGAGKSWARWRTKEAEGLDCRFLGKHGQLNLDRIERFGVHPTLNNGRADGDVLQFVFKHNEHVHATELKELLAEQLRGFREAFGASAVED
jgi:excinuclease ABC subunit A